MKIIGNINLTFKQKNATSLSHGVAQFLYLSTPVLSLVILKNNQLIGGGIIKQALGVSNDTH